VEQQSVSPQQAYDRLAIRELIDAYARCADRAKLTDKSAVHR
jgi:hypothetical protein